jgi:hypothetical protein
MVSARVIAQGDGDERPDPRDARQQLAHRIGPVGGQQLPLEVLDRGIELGDLGRQQGEHRRRRGRQLGRSQRLEQRRAPPDALARDDAELGGVAAQRIHRLGALADQQPARPQHQQRGLGLGRCHRHRADPLADRRRVAAVGFRPLDEGLDVLRRDQPRLVAQPVQQPGPMVRAATGFQHHFGRCLGAAELHEPGAREVLSDQHLARGVDPVQREPVLRRVEGNAGRIHGGRSLVGG